VEVCRPRPPEPATPSMGTGGDHSAGAGAPEFRTAAQPPAAARRRPPGCCLPCAPCARLLVARRHTSPGRRAGPPYAMQQRPGRTLTGPRVIAMRPITGPGALSPSPQAQGQGVPTLPSSSSSAGAHEQHERVGAARHARPVEQRGVVRAGNHKATAHCCVGQREPCAAPRQGLGQSVRGVPRRTRSAAQWLSAVLAANAHSAGATSPYVMHLSFAR